MHRHFHGLPSINRQISLARYTSQASTLPKKNWYKLIKMKTVQFLSGFALLALASLLASAYDPSPLQDLCVAINDHKDGGT